MKRTAARTAAPHGIELVEVQEGQGAWDVCNVRGITLQQLADLNKGVCCPLRAR